MYAWRKGQALVRRLLGPPAALSRLQSKVPDMELGTSGLSLGLVCFAVALVGGHREHFFATWEGGSWVASLKLSLRDGNLGIIIFTNRKREALLSFGNRCTT